MPKSIDLKKAPAFNNISFNDIENNIHDLMEWSYVEHEGDDYVRFDWRQGRLSMWLYSSMTLEGEIPTIIKNAIKNGKLFFKVEVEDNCGGEPYVGGWAY